jgi:NADPH2:quinone reductase
MRAVIADRFGGPEVLVLREMLAPTPGRGEVVIANRAIDVNFPDLLVIAGKYQVRPPFPYSPGKGVAGVVASVGAGVTGLKPGDRVMAQVEYGGYAEQTVAPAAMTFPLPAGLDFDRAAAMGLVYQTAWFALQDAHFAKGESVLVTGASGGVGMATVQLARALGAGRVLAGLTTPAKGDLARQDGADAIVDLSRPNLADSLREQVKAATGSGVDVVIDMLGGDAFDAALRALNRKGRIVIVGFAAGRIPEIKANYLLLKHISAIGMPWVTYRDFAPERVHAAQREMFDLVLAGKLDPRIMVRYSLAEHAKALADIAERRVVGRVVLVP